MKNLITIVVEDGLVQVVYATDGSNIDVEICDLDSTDPNERDKTEAHLARLRTYATQIY
jgi:hypothetical protein